MWDIPLGFGGIACDDCLNFSVLTNGYGSILGHSLPVSQCHWQSDDGEMINALPDLTVYFKGFILIGNGADPSLLCNNLGWLNHSIFFNCLSLFVDA